MLTNNALDSYFMQNAGIRVSIKQTVETTPARIAFGSMPAIEYTA